MFIAQHVHVYLYVCMRKRPIQKAISVNKSTCGFVTLYDLFRILHTHIFIYTLDYRFEFKQYSNRLIIHQLCDFNLAPHAVSNLSCYWCVLCICIRQGLCRRNHLPYDTIRDEYEMFLDTMMGFLLHTTMSYHTVFSTNRPSERERKGTLKVIETE